jgi:hypothetical protein
MNSKRCPVGRPFLSYGLDSLSSQGPACAEEPRPENGLRNVFLVFFPVRADGWP